MIIHLHATADNFAGLDAIASAIAESYPREQREIVRSVGLGAGPPVHRLHATIHPGRDAHMDLVCLSVLVLAVCLEADGVRWHVTIAAPAPVPLAPGELDGRD